MAGGSTSAGESYSGSIAYIYIFNLIVGVGALALPIGFKSAGLILGLIFLAVIGFLAYVTVTWINEVQAAGNALLFLEEKGVNIEDGEDDSALSWKGITPNINERTSLIQTREVGGINSNMNDGNISNIFEIKRRIELGHLSELFLGPIGQKLFYAILIIYLYGDLAIYAVTVPKSLAVVTEGITIGGHYISKDDVYYLYLAIFCVLIIPFSFFNFQKTKYLQLFTITTRNIALFTMIILGVVYIAEGHGASVHDIPWFNIKGLPALFGVSIYAFMCHHSLPSLISPIKNKKNLTSLMGADFITIFFVYSGLCASALFAFGDVPFEKCDPRPGHPCTIQQLYTLNFSSYNVRPIAIFLTLFPVFTLSTNFPLIAITLRNNLIQLIPIGENYPVRRQIAFSLLATMPPVAIAFATRNVDFLVSITGSYAGLGIMFVIPAFLVMNSRKKLEVIDPALKNPHTSPFSHKIYTYVVLAASVACVGLVTFNHIYAAVSARHHSTTH